MCDLGLANRQIGVSEESKAELAERRNLPAEPPPTTTCSLRSLRLKRANRAFRSTLLIVTKARLQAPFCLLEGYQRPCLDQLSTLTGKPSDLGFVLVNKLRSPLDGRSFVYASQWLETLQLKLGSRLCRALQHEGSQ